MTYFILLLKLPSAKQTSDVPLEDFFGFMVMSGLVLKTVSSGYPPMSNGQTQTKPETVDLPALPPEAQLLEEEFGMGRIYS